MKTAVRCPSRDTALVIGSGALFDIPLAELSGMFGRVLLADIVHPLSTRWQARRFSNVHLLTVDVTGILNHLPALPARFVQAPMASPSFGTSTGQTSPPLRPDVPSSGPPLTLFSNEHPDFTVSANILSQLPLSPLACLKRAGSSPDERRRIGRRILTDHLELLKALPGVVSLITDIQWRSGDAAKDLLHGLDSNLLQCAKSDLTSETWIWDIAPRPEAFPDKDVSHLVRACILSPPLP